MPRFLVDVQQALGFLRQQLTYIEPQVAEVQYPDIQYPQIIPVDTSANEWAKSVTYYSTNRTGQAAWFHHYAKDLHVADVDRSQHEVGIEMAEIGYRYTLEELGQAMMIPGMNLAADRAMAARRAADEFVDNVVINGDASKNFFGIMNYPGITIVNAAADGNNDSPAFSDKDPDSVLRDINAALTGQYVDTKTVELADTILLPVAVLTDLATRARSSQSDTTILDYLASKNVYTFTTGRPLMIRALRGLETAGVGGNGRMVVYRRDPQVLKFHMPMSHRFLPPWQTGPLVFDIPGIMRLGGLEVRRPGAVRYVDGISTPAYE